MAAAVTFNIMTDFGAANATADGKKQQLTITIDSDTNVLTTAESVWEDSDVGKYIAFTLPRVGDVYQVSGLRIINGRSSATSISLNIPYGGPPLSNSLQTVEWGHDDAPAFDAFNHAALDWQATHTGQIALYLPGPTGPSTGRYELLTEQSTSPKYYVDSGSMAYFANGIKDLIVYGDGMDSTILSGMLATGMFTKLGAQMPHAYIVDPPTGQFPGSLVDSVLAGSTSAILKYPSEASRFNVGDVALMNGCDVMGYGQPINPAFYEYVEITEINTDINGTVTIVFTPPLRFSYKDTWPLWNPGSTGGDNSGWCGGPANLFPMKYYWNMTLVLQDFQFDNETGLNHTMGRYVTLNRFRCLNNEGALHPSSCQSLTWNEVDIPNTFMEFDKIIDTFTINNSTVGGFTIKSVGCNHFFVNNTTFTRQGLAGTPRNLTATGTHFTSLVPGCGGFGVSDTMDLTNCQIDVLRVDGGFQQPEMAGGAISAFEMTNGLIKVPTSSKETFIEWAVPGANIFFVKTNSNDGYPFVVEDIWRDSGYMYIQTSMSGTWPTLSGTGDLAVHTHPCIKVTASGCWGCDAAVDISRPGAQGLPVWSYSKREYDVTKLLPAGVLAAPKWGYLSDVKLTVDPSYLIGDIDPLTALCIAVQVREPDGTAEFYLPTVDLLVAGTRNITAQNFGVDAILPLSNDSALELPVHSACWLTETGNIACSSDLRSKTPGLVLTVEILTDQQIVLPYWMVPAPRKSMWIGIQI